MKYCKQLAATVAIIGVISVPVQAAVSLPTEAQTALHEALQDEYHAEAFYAAVMDKFGAVRPFSNIIRAEQVHAKALSDVMKQYGMDVPANTQLGSKEILAAVPATLAEACKIGIDAEIKNAALYDDNLLPAVQGYDDIKLVFQNLRDASQYKHLPAFQRCSGR